MKALLPLLLALSFSASVYSAANKSPTETTTVPEVLLEVLLTPSETYVGQKRQLEITVLTDSWFTGANEFPYLEIDRALIQQPDSFATNASVQRNGISYSAQTRSYNIYPNATGQFVTPPIRVTAKVAAINTTSGTISTIKKQAYLPPQVFTVKPWLASVKPAMFATNVMLQQAFDLPLDTLKQGDVLTREVVITAHDSIGVLMPTITVPAITGVGIYSQRPEITESRNRGESVSRSKQVFSYVFESEGSYELPALVIRWWDVNNQIMAAAELPAVQIQVVTTGVATAVSLRWIGVMIGVLVLVFILFLVYRFGKAFINKRASTEAQFFRQLRSASKVPDEAFIRQYYQWEQSFTHQYGQTPAQPLPLAKAIQLLYSPEPCGTDIHWACVMRAIVKSRASTIRAIKRVNKSEGAVLPALNNTKA